jgi:ketosteroid isomerase-like protein
MPIEEPQQLHRIFAERVNVGDLDGLVALYEHRATFVGPDGASACGGDAIRERLRDLLAIAPRIVPGPSRSVIADDIALMSNSWRLTLTAGGDNASGIDGTSMEVARRQPDDGWLYVIDNPSLVG